MSWAPGPRAAAASPRNSWGSLSPARPSAAAGGADRAGAVWPLPATRIRSSGSSESSCDPRPGLARARPRAMVGGGGEGLEPAGRRAQAIRGCGQTLQLEGTRAAGAAGGRGARGRAEQPAKRVGRQRRANPRPAVKSVPSSAQRSASRRAASADSRLETLQPKARRAPRVRGEGRGWAGQPAAPSGGLGCAPLTTGAAAYTAVPGRLRVRAPISGYARARARRALHPNVRPVVWGAWAWASALPTPLRRAGDRRPRRLL